MHILCRFTQQELHEQGNNNYKYDTSDGGQNKMYLLQPRALIKEGILLLYLFRLEELAVTAMDDLVPDHHLVERLQHMVRA